MTNTNKDSGFKKFKANLLALFQTISELISIVTYFVFVLAFTYHFGQAIYDYIKSDFNPEILIKKCLTSFELLFIAPIPILVVFAFKSIISKTYPNIFNKAEEAPENTLQLVLAKKTFISSIIGVLATFTLGIFLSEEPIEMGKTVLFLGFLLILIVYYKFLSDHPKD